MLYLLLIAGLLYISTGCAPTPPDTPPVTTDTTAQYKNNISTLYGNGGKNKGDTASNIIWKDSLGNLHSLEELRGNIVLLNFWAMWCAPCESEMPELRSISETMGPDVIVIAISVDQGDAVFERVKLFAETRNMHFQVVVDPGAKSYFNYGGDGTIPQTVAIDRDGIVVHKFIGAQTRQKFKDILDQIP